MKPLEMGFAVRSTLFKEVCENCLAHPATQEILVRVRIVGIPKAVKIFCCKKCGRGVFDEICKAYNEDS